MNRVEKEKPKLVCSQCPLNDGTISEEVINCLRRQLSDPGDSDLSEPPACLNVPPKPEFKKGDRVLVKGIEEHEYLRRVFSHYEEGSPKPFHCFVYGADEWGSKGKTTGWRYCELWEETGDE